MPNQYPPPFPSIPLQALALLLRGAPPAPGGAFAAVEDVWPLLERAPAPDGTWRLRAGCRVGGGVADAYCVGGCNEKAGAEADDADGADDEFFDAHDDGEHGGDGGRGDRPHPQPPPPPPPPSHKGKEAPRAAGPEVLVLHDDGGGGGVDAALFAAAAAAAAVVPPAATAVPAGAP